MPLIHGQSITNNFKYSSALTLKLKNEDGREPMPWWFCVTQETTSVWITLPTSPEGTNRMLRGEKTQTKNPHKRKKDSINRTMVQRDKFKSVTYVCRKSRILYICTFRFKHRLLVKMSYIIYCKTRLGAVIMYYLYILQYKWIEINTYFSANLSDRVLNIRAFNI